MIYNFSSLKSVFLQNPIFQSDNELLSAFKTGFTEKSLFDNGIVTSFCIFEDKIHIGKNSLVPVVEYINDLFSIDITVTSLKKHAKFSKDKLEFFNVSSYDEFKSIFKSVEDKRVAARKEKKAAFSAQFEAPLPISLEGKKVLSLDFEYFISSKKIDIFEMGVTISIDDKIEYFHYTCHNKRMNGFKFGNSTLIDSDAFMTILSNHLDGVDFIVGHALPVEFKILRHNGFDMDKLETIKCIDTSSVLVHECITGKQRSVSAQQMSLKEALKNLKVQHVARDLHNAGNDSAFTMELLKRLIHLKKTHFSKGGTKKFKII